jgi:hypothetical protein
MSAVTGSDVAAAIRRMASNTTATSMRSSSGSPNTAAIAALVVAMDVGASYLDDLGAGDIPRIDQHERITAAVKVEELAGALCEVGSIDGHVLSDSASVWNRSVTFRLAPVSWARRAARASSSAPAPVGGTRARAR